MKIVKASKKQSRLRMAIVGQSGGGKTYTALALAKTLGERVIVIDTERKSASKYADKFEFDVLELETFSPLTYVKAIKLAQQEHDVVIIDSLSHAWFAKDGAIEQVDKIQRSNPRGNSFTAWRDVTPQHNEMIEAILQCSAHVIVTMRSKMEYVLEFDERTKKNVPRKVGLAPVQRDGMEYEFDVVGEINQDHFLTITKSRCSEIASAIVEKPGAEFASKLVAWLSDGEPVIAEHPAEIVADAPANDETAPPSTNFLDFDNNVTELLLRLDSAESAIEIASVSSEIAALKLDKQGPAYSALLAGYKQAEARRKKAEKAGKEAA